MESKSTLIIDGVTNTVKKKYHNRHFLRKFSQSASEVAAHQVDNLPDWASSLMYSHDSTGNSTVVVSYSGGTDTYVAPAGKGFSVPLRSGEIPTSVTVTPTEAGNHSLVLY